MSGYTSFVVVGAGGLGTLIVDELLKYKSSSNIKDVIVFTRSNNSKLASLAARGATVKEVDYSSPSSLSTALANVDVVISTVGLGAMDLQLPLAEAAKSAGVKLFVPTEFGDATDDHASIPDHGVLALKVATQKKCKELSLPYALFFTGPWSDYCFIPALGLDIRNGKASVGGDGNTPISWTTSPDIARFVVYVLTSLPASKLEWQTFRIEGERASFNQVFETYQKKTGKKVDVIYRSEQELNAAVASDANDFSSYIHLSWALGQGLVGKPEQLSNGLWPDWKPKNVLAAIAP